MSTALHLAARLLQEHWFPAGNAPDPVLIDHLKLADLEAHPAEIGVALALETLIEATRPAQPLMEARHD